jgi:hypothetical protein
MLDITLIYKGGLSDNSEIDLYDVSRALLGFQRSLALSAHLVLNGEIITQAPSLKGVQILSTTPVKGSWEITATVIAGIFAAGTAPKDTPFGHLIYSVYDYIVHEITGHHVDFNKSIGQLVKGRQEASALTEAKLDSLIEKTENAVIDMHRPIIGSKTAKEANLVARLGRKSLSVGRGLDALTYQYAAYTRETEGAIVIRGMISSYNTNTFKGRIFVFDEGRPISFELDENARSSTILALITDSLRMSALQRFLSSGSVELLVKRHESSTGRLKYLKVYDVRAG